MNKGKLTISIKSVYKCGHDCEIVYHMKNADVSDIIKTPPFPSLSGGPFHAHLEADPVLTRTLELSGDYESVEINGADWAAASLICPECGYYPVAEEQKQ